MNEKTGTGVNYMKEKVKESQFQSVTPSPDTPSGDGLGASQVLLLEKDLESHKLIQYRV